MEEKKSESMKDRVIREEAANPFAIPENPTHDDFRKLRSRGFRVNVPEVAGTAEGQLVTRTGEVRGKAAVKKAKRERRRFRELLKQQTVEIDG